ncbi:hypothetical protein [Halovulum sp. GXIMD14793]
MRYVWMNAVLSICCIVSGISSPALAGTDEVCGISAKNVPMELVEPLDRIRTGDYIQFVDLIDPNKKVAPEKRLNLSSGLEEYAEDGFASCTVLISENKKLYYTSFVVFHDDSRTLFAFFALGNIGGKWVFIKTHVSSDFDEVYDFVR